MQWLDPHGYYRKVPLFQSTPQALLIMAQHKRATHMPLRKHANDVSPLTAAVLSQPESAGARRVMFQSQQYDPSLTVHEHGGL
jgi:hypothetical protein